jgi:hypothetical protein
LSPNIEPQQKTQETLSTRLGRTELTQVPDREALIDRAAEAMEELAMYHAGGNIERVWSFVERIIKQGVPMEAIARWARETCDKVGEHWKSEAALYRRTDALRQRANERYGERPLFSLRKKKLDTIYEKIHKRLNQKSRERALAALVVGLVYTRMSLEQDAIGSGFSLACQYPEIAGWIQTKVTEFKRTGENALLQAAMLAGINRWQHEDALVQNRQNFEASCHPFYRGYASAALSVPGLNPGPYKTSLSRAQERYCGVEV